jgi:phosphotransferase system  glucose/maltose/N-acetylglucosamine-specific IIC component
MSPFGSEMLVVVIIGVGSVALVVGGLFTFLIHRSNVKNSDRVLEAVRALDRR